MAVQFIDNRLTVQSEIDSRIEAFIHDVKDSLSGQAGDNSKRVTGQLAGSFQEDSHVEITKSTATAYIGSSVEYSIYYELGTGEYALHGNGRPTGWVYYDPIKQKFIGTKGQTPKRPLYRAYIQKKGSIKQRAEDLLK